MTGLQPVCASSEPRLRRLHLVFKGLLICGLSVLLWVCWAVHRSHHQLLTPPSAQVEGFPVAYPKSDDRCDLKPYELTIEHLSTSHSSDDLVTINPDSPRAPRFSFKASSATTPAPEAIASHVQVIRRRNCKSSNCEEEDGVQVVWDSGWVLAGRRNGLDITHPDDRQLDGLIPMEQLFWRARFGIGDSNITVVGCPWSEYEPFLVGPSQVLWQQADWICAPNKVQTDCDFYDTTGKAAAPLFRTEFDISNGGIIAGPVSELVSSARLFVTGLGHYDAWMNGVHLNRDRYLDPAPSSYDKRIYYNSFDVTDVIVKSNSTRQALGFVVGNGWFNVLPMKFWGKINLRESMTVGTPRVRCILAVEFIDEKIEPLIITTSITSSNRMEWSTAESGLLRNDLYLGNVVDLDRTKWLEGWSKVGFNSPLIEWHPVITCPPPSGHKELPLLEPQPIPPIRSRPPHLLQPVSTTIIDSELVLDMGLNTAAVVHVEIFVPHDWVCSAQMIELKFGELLFPNGTVNGFTSVA